MSKFYSAQIAANKIGISYATMINIIKNKEITCTVIGKRKKFCDTDIEDYLNKDRKN